MQLNSVTELLGIANYKVEYMVHHSDKRIDPVLGRLEEKPIVCSGWKSSPYACSQHRYGYC